jgi:uncharacterized membrane protein YsdA (DUF1294 family)
MNNYINMQIHFLKYVFKEDENMEFLLSYLTLLNIFTLFVMMHDKKSAKNHRWRIPESTLFTLSFLGGSIGTLVGIYIFRHKTNHLKFTLGIPLILLLNLFLYVLIYTYVFK